MDYTAAQVGAANDPAAHAADYHPVDPPEHTAAADTPNLPAALTVADVHRWRLRGPLQPAPGPADAGTAGKDLAAEHLSAGRPNPRAQWDATAPAGYPLPKHEDLSTSPEWLASTSEVRVPEELAPQSPPDRVRAGSTGADPARTPNRWTAWFLRPFDKWAADHPGSGGSEKVIMASPLAATPLAYGDGISDPLPTAGGYGPTLPTPVGAAPNTWRNMPQPWDEQLVANGAAPPSSPVLPADNPEGARRARGWRA